MSFALGFLPIVLLLAGFPIYLVLLSSSAVALMFFSNTPLNVIHQNLFGSIDPSLSSRFRSSFMPAN